MAYDMSLEDDDMLKHGAWTPEEDNLLATFQKQYGNRWSVVAQHIPGRTGQQCAQRWRHKVNPHIRKEKWTAEEDKTLAALVAQHGNKWADIAKHIPGRTDQQCMGRWRRHLDPNIRKCQWLAKEDEILKAKYQEIGSQWSNISKFLAGRTAQQCRARWFQICPQEAQDIGATNREQPGGHTHTTHKRERHHDGNSIKASARQLLAQMESDSATQTATKSGRGSARRSATSSAPKAGNQGSSPEDDDDDEECWVDYPTTRRRASRGKPISRTDDEDYDSDAERSHGASRPRSVKGRPRKPWVSPTPTRRCKSSAAPRLSSPVKATPAVAELDPCDFTWPRKGPRTKASASTAFRRARTPSPCKAGEIRREDLVYFTPRSTDRKVPLDADQEDIEAADILTELSGSFHFVNATRKNSPASVRQPALNLLQTPAAQSPLSTIPRTIGDPPWGDSRSFLSPTQGPGGSTITGLEEADIGLETPSAMNSSRMFDPMGLSPMPHDLLMTPSSRNMLNKMSIEPLDKSIDLSIGFTPHGSTAPNTPASNTQQTSFKRRQDSDAGTEDDPHDKRTAARRLQFCASAATDGEGEKKVGVMLPPPPQTRAFESPQKKRRVEETRPDLSIKVEAETPACLPGCAAPGNTTLSPPAESKPPAVPALSNAADAPAIDASTPVVETIRSPQTAFSARDTTFIRDETLIHSSTFKLPANKENQLQGNVGALDGVHGQGSGSSSTENLDMRLVADDATATVAASSCQIKNHLENLLDDMFGGM